MLLISGQNSEVDWEAEATRLAEELVNTARHEWKHGGLAVRLDLRLPKDIRRLIKREARRSGSPRLQLQSSFQEKLQLALRKRLPEGKPEVKINKQRPFGTRLIASGL